MSDEQSKTAEALEAVREAIKAVEIMRDERDAVVARLEAIAGIAGGDYGINTEHSMERIYSLATGQPMRKPCPACRGGEEGLRQMVGSGTIVIPCQTCHGTGRVDA